MNKEDIEIELSACIDNILLTCPEDSDMINVVVEQAASVIVGLMTTAALRDSGMAVTEDRTAALAKAIHDLAMPLVLQWQREDESRN